MLSGEIIKTLSSCLLAENHGTGSIMLRGGFSSGELLER